MTWRMMVGATLTTLLGAQAGPPPAGDWSVRAGLTTLVVPNYVGSDGFRLVAFPALQAEYKQRLVLGTSKVAIGAGLDVRVIKGAGWSWDLGLAMEERRPENRADALAGMGNRAASLWVGTGWNYRQHGWNATVAVSLGLRDEAGVRGLVSAGREWRLGPQWAVGLNASLLASNAEHMAFDFGISQEQAARRAALLAAGDPRLRPGDARSFSPSGGLRESRLSGNLLRFFPDRWVATAVVFGTRLTDEPSGSPLVRRRTNVGGGLVVAKSF